MSGVNMLILCTLSLLCTTSEALAAKDTAPAPAPADLHQEHHEAHQELKKLLQGKSPEEIAALRKKVDESGGGVVSKVASAAASVATSAAGAAVSAVAGAKWGACPDGFASQRAGDGCCSSQALKHLKQAKMLCEGSDGWKTAQSSAEAFTCCPPAKAAVVAAAPSAKEKEVADLKKQVSDLKALLEKDSKHESTSHAPAEHAPAPAVGHVHKEDAHKKKATHSAEGKHKSEHPDHMTIKMELKGESEMPPELDGDIENMMEALEPHPLDREKHHNKYVLPSHLSQKQANDAYAQAMEDEVIVVRFDEPASYRGTQGGWDFSYFIILGALAALVYWFVGPGASHKDMRHVQIPGYGNVNADIFQGGNKEECGDLFEAGYTKGNYGGATFKPMKNVGGSDFSRDDLGL